MTQTAEPAESAAPKPREPLIREITLRNFLSFGPDTPPLELRPLNVLIGPNGSGKSNLIEAIAVLHAMPTDVRKAIRRGGGVMEWLWKGKPESIAGIRVQVTRHSHPLPLEHTLTFCEHRQHFQRVEESIDDAGYTIKEPGPNVYYKSNGDRPPLIRSRSGDYRHLSIDDLDFDSSIVAQIKEPEQYPEIALLTRSYSSFRLYQEWHFGRSNLLREPQQADERNDRVEEDFSNLGLFLSKMERKPVARRRLLEQLRNLYEGLDDYRVVTEGGTVQVFFIEGDFSIPARRLSDGTLRYLCLLAILCDPEPPPLICLEEPELGLHPDLLPKLADLLVEASERTQLIVTTHSEILVDALTAHPESIVVCEKHEGQTQMKRLNADDLSEWLEKYRLGDLWSSGQIGGNRW